MIVHKNEKIETQVEHEFICDCCKQPVICEMERQEAWSIRDTGGYSSIFGDMNSISLDLCQQCIQKLLGDYIQIS